MRPNIAGIQAQYIVAGETDPPLVLLLHLETPGLAIGHYVVPIYCNCIVTRGGVYDEISLSPREIPRAEQSQYSHYTVILNYIY